MPLRRRLQTALVIAVIALATGLPAGCATRMSERDLTTSLNAIQPVPGRKAVRRVVPVYAQTPMEAWVLRQEAEGTPDESPLSAQLAAGFSLGRVRKVDYIVGGPHAKLTDRLVLNGLTMSKGDKLPGLRIVLVGPDPPTKELVAAANAKRVRLEHRSLD